MILYSQLFQTASVFRTYFNKCKDSYIQLSNEGAPLVVLEPSSISIQDLRACNFAHSFCREHFKTEQLTPLCVESFQNMEPFVMFVQHLKDGGMMLVFALDHCVADVNAMHLVVADFCCHVKNKTFKYDQQQVNEKYFLQKT